jgi:beta-phosphoglucomutase-like phosphatase (HAD superfamily)
LASSSGKQEIDHYVELLNVRDMLHAVTTKDDVDKSKPAPDIFSEALKTVAPIQAIDVIAIGDTPYDGMAATRCGIFTLGLRSGGFSDEELSHSGMSEIYDDIEHVYEALGK